MQDETFYRGYTDGTWESLESLRGMYAGTAPSPAWIIGGGPSLNQETAEIINASPAPKMCVNYGGRGGDGEGFLVEPDFWTTFDPTSRFSRYVFLNPRIKKFCNGGRRMDLVPGGTEKVCDCPNTVLINLEHRGYRNFVKPGGKVLHALDSFLQAIDILYHLGFRTIYCVGTDLVIRPSEAQIEMAVSAGVSYDRDRGTAIVAEKKKDEDKSGVIRVRESDLLSDFVTACEQAELYKTFTGDAALDNRQKCLAMLSSVGREKQYNFTEMKSIGAAIATDSHYWRSVQYLRLARKCMSSTGLNLVSCTPSSRLNEHFRNIAVEEAAAEIRGPIGDSREESTNGKFSTEIPPGEGLLPMGDISPYGWPPKNLVDAAAKADGKADSVPKEKADQLTPTPARTKILEKFNKLQGDP